ncbi:prepilin-type N-terminal cleavage/methylation domain-containing protein [uncultured Bradyrhizobium sp.]|uniref:prepilin-type N-terminal cleavage/methylation domain-containing protein n=1 Tax=Bradyrhizobium sp. TaxID=376 RepID=UPI002627977A|nr:prepilin-type N-terminal cleavage/methylation domain-containing protein [uncultured Bradyrhizobium sp.]
MTRDIPVAARHGTDDEAGFTLVELLVGLALFSLLATMLFGSVRFGLQAWQRGRVNTERFERIMISQDLLRRAIGNFYPMLVRGEAIQPYIDFDGAKEAISFLGYAPTVANGGRFRFKVFVERPHGETSLVVNAAPELSDPNVSSNATRTILLSGIERAEFAYFGAPSPGQGPQWNDSWTKRTDIPSLVRIRVIAAPGVPELWPDLLIAPRIQADVACVYEPITMRCRGR